MAAALQATTFYRQQQLLAQLIETLRSLRERLVSTPHMAYQTGSVIDHWLRILQQAVTILQTQADSEGEIPPVYVAGGHLRTWEARTLFKGRVALFAEIENLLLSPRPPVLFLHGQRRTGKTSLLAHLPEKLPAEIIPLAVNMQGAAEAETHAGLAYRMAESMAESARRDRKLTVQSWPRSEFASDPFVVLGDWMTEVEKRVPNRKFLLCLDEFARLEEIVASTGSRAPLNFLRNLLEHRQRWMLLLSGSHLIAELAPYWSDYLINTRRLHISYLEPDEARDLIEHPTLSFESHMRYESAATEHILYLTHGQPFLVQLICADLVDHLNRENHRHKTTRNIVTVDDVEAVLNPAMEHGGFYFDELWQTASETERGVLKQIATETFVPANGTTEAIDRLQSRELIEPCQGGYRFQVPLIQRWVLNHLKSAPYQ